MRFAIFPLHPSKVLRLPRRGDARSYEVLHLSRKIIFPKLKIWCTKMQPLSGNQRPNLLTSLMNMFFVLRLPRKIHLGRSLHMSHACHRFYKCYKTFTPGSPLRRCTIPCACHAKWHLNLQKWSEPGVLCTFWFRNVLRATTACNFSYLIWPAGSAPANTVFRDFPTFSRAWVFFWDFLFFILFLLLLSSLTLPISAFHLSMLSEVWLLNFLR